MKPQKDIFELFKEQEPHLRVQPSPRAWEKLERKLDGSRKRLVPLFYRRLAFAASFLLLVGTASVLYLRLQPQTDASAEAQPRPMFLEDIEPGPPSAMLAQALTIKKYYYGYRPEEGQSRHALTERINVAPSQNASKPEDLLAQNGNLPDAGPSAEAGKRTTESDSETSLRSEQMEEPYADVQESEPVAPSARQAPVASDQAKKEMATAPALQAFEWLAGTWESRQGNQVNREVWRFLDAQTLVGEGSLIVDGKPILTETMYIQTTGGALQYALPLSETGSAALYPLRESQDAQMHFSNLNQPFPQEIILQKEGEDQFTTILRNAAPEKGDGKDQEYLLYRNQWEQKELRRTLKRVQ